MMGMLSCRDVTRLVSQGQDRALGLGERIALRTHFFICKGCRSFEDQLRFMRRAMQRLSESGEEDAGRP